MHRIYENTSTHTIYKHIVHLHHTHIPTLYSHCGFMFMATDNTLLIDHTYIVHKYMPYTYNIQHAG